MRRLTQAVLVVMVLLAVPLTVHYGRLAARWAVPGYGPDPFLGAMEEVNRDYSREAEEYPGLGGEAQARRIQRAKEVYRRYGRPWPPASP